MNKEPAAIISAVTAAVTAVLALLVAFGLELTGDQQAAILGVAAVVAPLVAGLVTRSAVFSPASVERLLAGGNEPGAHEAGRDDTLRA